MPEIIKVVRGLSVFLIIVLYAVLVHHVNISPNKSGIAGILSVVLAFIPPLLLVFGITAKTRGNVAGVAVILIFIFLIGWFLPVIKHQLSFIFWLQDIGLMLMLLFTFARTLQHGKKPLCVYFAEIINGGALPVAHERYARNVTIAWVIFFAMIAIVSTLLFFLAPLAVWSIFVNFFTLPLVALMFIAEFIVRRQLLSDLPDGNVMDAVRAYLNHSKRASHINTSQN